MVARRQGDQHSPLFLALIVVLVGVLIAWRWELVGWIVTIVGAVALIAQTCFGSGPCVFLCSLFVTLPLFMPRAVYAVCRWRTRAVPI